MRKNKAVKWIVNSVVLASMAALGITVYQIGTSPSKENYPMEEFSTERELAMNEETDKEPMVDADTSNVEADIKDAPAETVEADTWNPAAGETASDAAQESTPAETEVNTLNVSAEALALPEINFSEDTLMEWPVNGNILVDYSMDQTTYFATLDQYKLSPAISVQAVEGAPVVAAANGTVYSIENDARTGTTVTMELGNSYQAVYGQLTDLTVSEGDTVKKGTIIGYIATPTKYYSKEGSNLYYAMKRNGEPIDPILYLP